VENRLPVNIEDVDDNGVIEIDVVSQIELKIDQEIDYISGSARNTSSDIPGHLC
jgi:hypothetical protein